MPERHEPKYLYSYANERRRRKRRKILFRRLLALTIVCALVVGGVFIYKGFFAGGDAASQSAESTTTTIPPLEMTVTAIPSTSPANFDFVTDIFRGGNPLSTYKRPEAIEFGRGKDYTSLEGIITFRGNNYREGASYGTASIAVGSLATLWQVPTGSVARGSGAGAWTGSGWTGQPLIVRWPEDVKQIMNIYPEKKIDPNLVEVIYPCLDGKIYFLDLRDGLATRPVIETGGGAIKGTASLYPDGTPMLFVGQGDNLPGSNPDGVVRVRIYNLMDQSLMYTFGNDDPVAYRKWQAFDASPLVDVETGTLIQPGENGILYTVKLNTKFDKATGLLTIAPEEPIKFRYTARDYADGEDNSPTTRWWGMEDSPVAWNNYLYVSDNGGKLMCIDLNTMELVWAQDIWDDSNSTPLFEESLENGTAYIYISTSLHITGQGDSQSESGKIPIWKINAATGEKVWESTPFHCYSLPGVSGGVEGTGILGQHDISNLVIYPVARTPSTYSGLLVALDKNTGQEVWRFEMSNYAWSSPVAVYTPEGKSYIVICDSIGNIFLLEGATGQLLSSMSTTDKDSPIEASPAVFGNTLVIGTRGQRIFGIQIQ